MLHGFKIKEGKAYKSTKLFEGTSGEFATFHISMAVLENAASMKDSDKARVCVQLEEKYGKNEVTLASLTKQRDMTALDLYINCTQEVAISVKDAPKGCEVSMSGYFEPKGDDMDDDMFAYGREGDEEDEDDDDLEDEDDDDSDEDAGKKGLVVKGKAIAKKDSGAQQKNHLSQSLNQAKQNANKNSASTAVHDEDLEDSDESDLDEEGEDVSKDEEAQDDDSDEEDDDDEEDDSEDAKPAVVSAKK